MNPKTQRRLGTVALGCMLLGMNLLAGCAAARKVVPYPSARVEGVQLKGLTLSSFTLQFDIEVENPYGVDLPVIGMEYSLASNAKRFLEGRVDAGGSIPANGSEIVPMAVKIPFVELYEVVEGVGPGTTIPYEAELGLEVKTPLLGGVKLPLKEEGELTLPSVP
jgi:LEA14-like dessication related protein